MPENEITLFSTVNLQIFQNYYGDLHSNADNTERVYGKYELVSQFINSAPGLKEWREDQGSLFDDASQPTRIGALWYHKNQFCGDGLYAAGEVTGDIHSAKRLGSNNVIEILVSGRTAAQAIEADNK